MSTLLRLTRPLAGGKTTAAIWFAPTEAAERVGRNGSRCSLPRPPRVPASEAGRTRRRRLNSQVCITIRVARRRLVRHINRTPAVWQCEMAHPYGVGSCAMCAPTVHHLAAAGEHRAVLPVFHCGSHSFASVRTPTRTSSNAKNRYTHRGRYSQEKSTGEGYERSLGYLRSSPMRALTRYR
jgi:hypothetical protein